jgi:hypothetical protein
MESTVHSAGLVFLCNVTDVVFNRISSYVELKDFVTLHHVLASNKECRMHWEYHLRQHIDRTEQLFDEFTSLEALRWTVFTRKIDKRDFQLHLKGPRDTLRKGKHKYLTHNESFLKVCEDGELNIVRTMAERTHVDLETKDALHGRTPLLWAAINGHLPVIQYLCEEHGVDKEARGPVVGTTPLHLAAEKGHLPVVQYLCEHEADMEARDNIRGKTPLHYAAEMGHLAVVQHLCDQEADMEARDVNRKTPQYLAFKNNYISVSSYLIDAQARWSGH